MDDFSDYQYDGYDYGVVNATPPVAIAPPDSTGGRGSFLPELLNTLTNGINATLAAKINDRFGEGISSGLATVDSNGNLVYRASPAQTPSPNQVIASQAIRSPAILVLAAAAVLVLVLALRK